MKKNDYMKFIVLSLLVVAVYIPTFIWMYERWSAPDTYYSHGFLIPLVSGFIVWLKRKELAQIKSEPLVKAGWLLFASGIAVHLISTLWQVSFTSAFSLLIVMMGLILLFFGKDYLRQLAFPLAFLIFMIPLPMLAIANISFRLKIFAAQVSTKILNTVGVGAVREGSVIKTAHSYLMVEDPCSGIRSLVALIALGALMAYFSNLSRKKQVILFASSVPIAIGTNIIRIVALSLASEIYGSQFAGGLFHDTMGILVFVFAFIALAFVAKILE